LWANYFGGAHGPFSDQRTASVRIWRQACGGDRSAVLVRIDDPNQGGAPANLVFPFLRAQQGGYLSELSAMRLDGSGTVEPFSVGNLPGTYAISVKSGPVSLSTDFALIVEDAVSESWQMPGGRAAVLIPAFAPTPSTYPLAFGGRPLNGRYAGNFYDPAKPGEGVIMELGEVSGSPPVRYLQFAWFTFDNNGQPFWLAGGANLPEGTTHVHASAVYRAGGGFAGTKVATQLIDWGSVDFEFKDCNTLSIDYLGRNGLPANVPKGSGHLQLQRLTTIRGNACE
jgi:hypothetical protein